MVALPRAAGPRVPGLPADDAGFIPTDEHGRVAGLERVWAAGDGTNFPIKQGGLARTAGRRCRLEHRGACRSGHRPGAISPRPAWARR